MYLFDIFLPLWQQLWQDLNPWPWDDEASVLTLSYRHYPPWPINWVKHFVHIFIQTCWNLNLCQNLMVFHQNIDGNMKFRYSLIIINHQIVEKTSNFHQKWSWKVNFAEYIWANILVHVVHIFPLVFPTSLTSLTHFWQSLWVSTLSSSLGTFLHCLFGFRLQALPMTTY